MGLFIEETIVGVLIGLGMELMGMPNALLIGVFAGAINIIPYIGPFIGMFFAFFVIICTNSSLDFYHATLPALGKTFLLIQIVHLLDNMFLQPIIYSNSVKAHPLEIFIVILAAGMLAGIPGLLCAIPAYTLVRIIAREFLGEFKIVQSITENMYE
jgi:predicted PurR-regulated permease PerM